MVKDFKMNRIVINILIWILALVSAFGAEAGDLEIYYPEMTVPAPIERTGFQKGIGISTDVIALALPVSTIAGVLIAQDWEGLKQGAFTAAASVGAMLILKYSVRELRPDHSNYHSFPSGHTTVSFASAAFLQRRYGWKFGAPAYALATYTAVGRVLAKKHHWWDVVAGAAIGAARAYIFTTPWAREHEFSMAPVATDEAVGLTASFTF